MDPIVAPLVGAGVGALGQIFANEGSAVMSREQMAFQERMSSTAYQRATRDMRKAGLNPMLAFSQGGASSPVGSMPDVGNVGASAFESAQMSQGLRESEARTLDSLTSAALNKEKAAVENVTARTMETDLPAHEVKKFLFKQGSKMLPKIEKAIDRLLGSAKERAEGSNFLEGFESLPGSGGVYVPK